MNGQEILQPDTKINVIGRGLGVIIETIRGFDQFRQPINSYKVEIRKVYSDRRFRPIKPYQMIVNYSFIQLQR